MPVTMGLTLIVCLQPVCFFLPAVCVLFWRAYFPISSDKIQNALLAVTLARGSVYLNHSRSQSHSKKNDEKESLLEGRREIRLVAHQAGFESNE